MYNPAEDNEMDAMSREAAREYRSPGSPNWDAMKAELDKVLPVEKKKKPFFFFWWLLPLMMAAGLGWWLNRDNTDLGKSTLSTNKVQEIGGKKSGNTPKPVPELDKNNTTHPRSNQNTALILIEKTKGESPDKVNPYMSNRDDIRNHNLQKQMTPLIVSTNKLPTPEKFNDPVYSIMPTTPEKKSGQPNQFDLAISSGRDKENNAGNNEIQPGNTLTENKLQPPDSILPLVKKKSKKTAFLPLQKGWSLALLTGVDKSTVKFKYGNDAGYSIGLVAGYHFNDRWSLHTGAIYTTKNYKLEGKDFHPSKGSWASYYNIETIDGYCNMWEVPLQVRYKLSGSAKNSIYLNTGLSSYFMNREFYNYLFYNNGVLTIRSYAYPSNDTHVFSIGHLSVVFDKRISNNLSMQWEPYAKIPFSGVGLGNIQLSSFGINLSLVYRHTPAKMISKK